MEKEAEMKQRVRDLARRRGAVILAHHYQVDEVKEVADEIGDSYQLSVVASRLDAPVIVMCGVRFMAEGVAVLSPGKTVLLPSPDAGCPLADTMTAKQLRTLKKRHPKAPVVAYVNTGIEVKAEADCCCTSSNAIAVVQALEADEIIFVPDGNLARHVAGRTGRRLVIWEGSCPVHQQISAAEVERLKEKYPESVFVAHPECRPEVLALADEVTSTTGFFRFAAKTESPVVIVGTEEGVMGRLERENPGKRFLLPRPRMVCRDMKKTTLEDVERALAYMEHRVTVEDKIAERARRALVKMVSIAG